MADALNSAERPFSSSHPRVRLAVDASCEAEACAQAILDMYERIKVTCPEVYAVRSLAIRLLELSGIVINTLEDEGADLTEIRYQLTGIHTNTEEGKHG